MSAQCILLVDPRPGRRSRISSSLKDHYEVIPCDSPALARRQALQRRPGLALLSLRQLTGNGFQLAKQLRADGVMSNRLLVVYGKPTGRPIDDAARRRIERLWKIDRLVLAGDQGAELADAVAELLARRPRAPRPRRRNELPPAPPAAVAASPVKVVSARRPQVERAPSWRELFTGDVSVGNLRRLLNRKLA